MFTARIGFQVLFGVTCWRNSIDDLYGSLFCVFQLCLRQPPGLVRHPKRFGVARPSRTLKKHKQALEQADRPGGLGGEQEVQELLDAQRAGFDKVRDGRTAGRMGRMDG